MSATIIRFSTDATRNITGLAGGADGRIAILVNIGTNNAVLKDENTGSLAANRFALGADITIGGDQAVTLEYDATSSRWRCIGTWLGNVTGGITQLTGDVTAGPGSGSQVATLASTAVTAGSYGSATQVGTFTVDAKGRLTAAGNTTITPAASSITGGAALTKTDDTNVTLTLGGSPSAALLAAASLTLGWTGQLSIARGGTSQSTALGARGSSGLNIEGATGHGDSDYTILATDRVVYTNAAFTAARTWTLPAANAVNAGGAIMVSDLQGTLTASHTLSIARAGTDTINGGSTSVVLNSAYSFVTLVSDGSSKWTIKTVPFTAPTHQFVTGISSLGAWTSGQPAASDISGGAALTKTDDTNVTLTLGGTPTAALLAAASLTLGWTGQLSQSRGGTGKDTSAATDGQILIGKTSDHSLNLATITAGSGISVTNGAGAITIAATGGGGTVTSVSSPDASITITSPTTAPTFKINTEWISGYPLINGYFKCSVSVNVLTIAIKNTADADPSSSNPVYIAFNKNTGGQSDYFLAPITSALSMTVSNGSTLGASNGVVFRLWFAMISNAGTPELAVVNARSGNTVMPLNEEILISTTAEGGAGAADSAQVWYSATARSNVVWRLLGYAEFQLTTAGQWDTAPSHTEQMNCGIPRPGTVVQIQRTDTGTVATGTTTIPADNTIPQSTEGDQYMSQAITPTAGQNLLRVRSSLELSNSNSSNGQLIASLLQDSTANALAATYVYQGANTGTSRLSLDWMGLAATNSSTTFKVRAGGAAAGTTTFNGSAATQEMGGVSNSFLEVQEIMA